MRRVRLVLAAAALTPLLLAGPVVAAEAVTAYVVKPGDTLYDLASDYLIRTGDYRIVQRRNRVADPRRLSVGSRLSVPTRLLRTEVVEARLGAFRGDVTIVAGGRPAAAVKGVVVGEGQTIVTGPNAFARLDLPDGSRVTLPSQSRIRVDRLRRTLMTDAVDRQFTVEAGRSQSTVTPLRNPEDRYIIRTPMSVSAVRGTEFRVWYAPEDRRASTEVVTGSVAVEADRDRSAVVPAEFGVTAGVEGDLTPRPLPPAPRLRDPGKVQDGVGVAFEIAPEAVARLYRAQIAADAGFLDVIAEAEAEAPTVGFSDVPDGDYFVRTTVIAADGLEGVPATYAFERTLNTLDLSAPTASQDKRVRRYLFRWAVGGAGERTYRFQLLRDGREAAPVIDETGLTEQQITVTDLPPGDYSWRVLSRTFSRGRHVDKWSSPQQFKLGS